MDTFRLTITGSDALIDELQEFCRKQGIQAERVYAIANDVTTPVLAALLIIAQFDVIPKCITAFRKNRKRPAKFTRFIEGRGFEEFEGYSADEVTQIISETDTI